jgi:hypothetical protein
MARPHEPLRHEPVLEVERMIMVDLATTQAQTKGASPFVNRKESQTEAIMAKPLNMLLPPPADRVDKLYHQLVEIHAIATAQLVECAHW